MSENLKSVFDEIAERLDDGPRAIFALIGLEMTEDGHVGKVTYSSNVDRDVMAAVFENMAKMLRENKDTTLIY